MYSGMMGWCCLSCPGLVSFLFFSAGGEVIERISMLVD